MDIKLIAIDIDGTLLNQNNQLTQPTIDAINNARIKGVKVVLCTGRPLTGVKPYNDKIGITGSDEYAITFNGSIVETTSGEVIDHYNVTYDDFLEIEMTARKLGVHFQIETTEFAYILNKDVSPYSIAESYLVRLPMLFRTPEEISKDLIMSKLMFVDEPDLITEALNNLPDSIKGRVNYLRSEPYFIEFVNKKASKGTALEALANRLGLTQDNVMAIGDRDNDLSMIKYAGLGVAMGNGIDEVKDAAKFTTKTNAEDGVAFAINKFVND